MKPASALPLLLISFTAFAQTAPAESAGNINAVIPKASVFRAGQNSKGKMPSGEPAVKDMPISWGDIVRTESSGRARIRLNDGSLLSLGSESTLRVVRHDSRSQQTALELGYGRIRCRVTALTRDGNFELRTPTAVAGVIGTDFGADSSQPDLTQFVCVNGTVRITSSDPAISGSVDCAPGMTVTVRRGQAPSPATPATPEQIERWQHIAEPADSAFAGSLIPVAAEAMKPRSDSPQWLRQFSSNPGVHWHGIDVDGAWRVRGEMWDWFDVPPSSTADDRYAFLQSILRIGVGQQHEHWDWRIELAQPSLLGLPDNAVVPLPGGQLGLGATYFAANGNQQNAAAIFPSQAFVAWRGLSGNSENRLTLGRFRFIDGTETTPENKTLAWLKQARLAHRLLGDFGFSVTGRSNDGASLSWRVHRSTITLATARPTRGVFNVNGLGELDVAWAYGALTMPVAKSHGELRIFALGYDDARAVTKTDNRPALLRVGNDRFQNITIGTFGAHYIQTIGAFDVLFWGAGQTGTWGTQDHRAGAFTTEVGWQPTLAALRPWLRLGFYRSSGDSNSLDGKHGTFFQVLPTPRLYARYPFYNGENSSDASAMLVLRPSGRLTVRSEAHSLWLTDKNDLWYSGGGAFDRNTFGYQGRISAGNRGLANVWDLSADFKASTHWTLGAYYAHAVGKGVVKASFPAGPSSNYGYVESTFQF